MNFFSILPLFGLCALGMFHIALCQNRGPLVSERVKTFSMLETKISPQFKFNSNPLIKTDVVTIAGIYDSNLQRFQCGIEANKNKAIENLKSQLDRLQARYIKFHPPKKDGRTLKWGNMHNHCTFLHGKVLDAIIEQIENFNPELGYQIEKEQGELVEFYTSLGRETGDFINHPNEATLENTHSQLINKHKPFQVPFELQASSLRIHLPKLKLHGPLAELRIRYHEDPTTLNKLRQLSALVQSYQDFQQYYAIHKFYFYLNQQCVKDSKKPPAKLT